MSMNFSGIRGVRRSNGAVNVASKTPITLEQAAELAPSIMASDKKSDRSDRYTYVPTYQIVEHLAKNGYAIHAVMQSGSRDGDKGHAKHLVRLRPVNSVPAMGENHPEIAIMNSHDGSSSYRLIAGIFRLVCSNGLVVSDATIGEHRVRHSGDILGDISESVERIRLQLPSALAKAEEFRAVKLAQPEQLAFARAALAIRYGTTEEAPISAEQVLRPRRSEDTHGNLWTTLNTVQESLIRGGHRYTSTTGRTRQRRTTGAVNSVEQNTGINRAIWQLAEEMQKLKA